MFDFLPIPILIITNVICVIYLLELKEQIIELKWEIKEKEDLKKRDAELNEIINTISKLN